MIFAQESTGVVWHYWLALSLVIGAIAVVAAVAIGYLMSVTRTRYPRD